MNTCVAQSRRDRAFATFVAVVMISLVGTALLAMTVLIQVDVRRSKRVGAEVQMRQLLLAGGAAACQSVMKTPDTAWTQTVQLPADMEEAAVKIDYAISNSSHRTVTVTASNDDYRARQVMSFEHADGSWELSAVEVTRSY